MTMPKFIRRWKRKRDWHAYGQTNKALREVQREYNRAQECCPDYANHLFHELELLDAKRGRLYLKLTQEV